MVAASAAPITPGSGNGDLAVPAITLNADNPNDHSAAIGDAIASAALPNEAAVTFAANLHPNATENGTAFTNNSARTVDTGQANIVMIADSGHAAAADFARLVPEVTARDVPFMAPATAGASAAG